MTLARPYNHTFTRNFMPTRPPYGFGPEEAFYRVKGFGPDEPFSPETDEYGAPPPLARIEGKVARRGPRHSIHNDRQSQGHRQDQDHLAQIASEIKPGIYALIALLSFFVFAGAYTNEFYQLAVPAGLVTIIFNVLVFAMLYVRWRIRKTM